MLAPPFEVRLRRLWRGRLGESWYFWGASQRLAPRWGSASEVLANVLWEVDAEAVEAIGGAG